jgi:beta-phosphoglucomutase-like phosphatase (HAD superfamily)
VRPARAVIVDFNGTLAEDDALLINIYRQLLREHGIAFGAHHYARYAGIPDRAIFEQLFAAHGRRLADTTAARLLRARVERYLSAVRDDLPVAKETVAFVRTLARHVPVGVASGAFRAEIEHVLGAAGLSEHVSVIVGIEEVDAGKPDPESFTAALAHINRDRAEPLASHETVVIEDTTDGARAARAAGMRCVALRGRAYDEASKVADLVVERLTAGLAHWLVGSPR